jgi:hypothetical protein
MLDAEFDVVNAPDLRVALRELAARFERAAGTAGRSASAHVAR